jgi:hypothetical protein
MMLKKDPAGALGVDSAAIAMPESGVEPIAFDNFQISDVRLTVFRPAFNIPGHPSMGRPAFRGDPLPVRFRGPPAFLTLRPARILHEAQRGRGPGLRP